MFRGGAEPVNPQHVIAYEETGIFTQKETIKQDCYGKAEGIDCSNMKGKGGGG